MKKALFIVFLLGFSYLFAYEPVVREFDVWDRGGLFNLLEARRFQGVRDCIR